MLKLILGVLYRIEHKIDCILYSSWNDKWRHMRFGHSPKICPICKSQVTSYYDPIKQVTVFDCACYPNVPSEVSINPLPLDAETVRQIVREELQNFGGKLV